MTKLTKIAKARFIMRESIMKIQCSECNEIISRCAFCAKVFMDNQNIQCINRGEFHACEEGCV